MNARPTSKNKNGHYDEDQWRAIPLDQVISKSGISTIAKGRDGLKQGPPEVSTVGLSKECWQYLW